MGGFLTTSAMLGRDAMKLMRLVKEWRPEGDGPDSEFQFIVSPHRPRRLSAPQ